MHIASALGADAQPADFLPGERDRIRDSLGTREIIARVARRGVWSDDQFGVCLASYAAQEECRRILAAAPAPTITRYYHDYASGQSLPVGDTY